MQVGQAALEVRNFNLLMAVLAGLNAAAVQRLKKTWKLVAAKLSAAFAALEALMSSAKNYACYRAALAAAEWPKLPYFGVFLRDLQFVEVGNETWIASTDTSSVVNFEKVSMLAALLEEVESYKSALFPFTAVPTLQNYFRNLNSMDEEALHRMSVAAEPIVTQGPNYLEETIVSPGRASETVGGGGDSGLLSPKPMRDSRPLSHTRE